MTLPQYYNKRKRGGKEECSHQLKPACLASSFFLVKRAFASHQPSSQFFLARPTAAFAAILGLESWTPSNAVGIFIGTFPGSISNLFLTIWCCYPFALSD